MGKSGRCQLPALDRPQLFLGGGKRSAFTLIELLLVLALLVIIGAIVTPAIFGPLESQKLTKSADVIRSAMSEARVNAMRTGLIHVFQYRPETGQYIIRPWVAEQDVIEGNPLEQPLGLTPGESPYQAYATWEDLPERVIFAHGSVQDEIRWQMHLADEGTENLTDSTLAPPIVFYPDGTTSDAQIWLSSESKEYFVSIQMRGMTGVSRVGPLMSAEELQ